MNNKLNYDVIVRCLEYDPVGFFYRAFVIKKAKKSSRILLYNDQNIYMVNNEMLFQLKGVNSHQMILQGDHMLCAVMNEQGQECFVPGIVQSIKVTPDDTKMNYYLMLYFNGQYGENVSYELVKVSKSIYGVIVDQIFQKIPVESQLKPFVPEKDDKINIMNFINKSIATQVKASVSHEINLSFENLNFDLKYNELAEKIDQLDENNIEQKVYAGKSLAILEEMKSENKKVKELRKSLNKNIKSEIDRIRTELPKLKVNEVVLAKWSDDGWYYFGTITEILNDYTYLVIDMNNYEERILRENIVSLVSNKVEELEEYGAVIAPHPNYSLSYAPGLIMNRFDTFRSTIRFYDGVEGLIGNESIYYIGLCKFEIDIAEIIRLESNLINQEVIARNNFTGRYEIGLVKEKLGHRRKFIVQFDRPAIVEDISHIIIKDNKNKNVKLQVDDCVLAKKTKDDHVYYLGSIIEKEGINYTVQFIDGQIVSDMNQMNNDLHKLTKEYCRDICKFYNSSLIKHKH